MFLYYIYIFFIVTLAGALIYTVFSLSTHLVAGTRFTGFSPLIFIKGIFITAPLSLLVSPLFIARYLIRHRPSTVWVTGFYCLLYILTCMLIAPLLVELKISSECRFFNVVEVNPLSPRYFRVQDDNLFYYSKVNKDFIAEGICVDTDMNTIYTFSDTLLPAKTKGFVDPLIEQNLSLPAIISHMLFWAESYFSMTQRIVKYGFLPWLCFCSFFLAILSVVFLRYVSNWRLIDTLLSDSTYLVVISFNYWCCNPSSLLGKIAAKVNSLLGASQGRYNLFLTFSNILLFAALVTFGIIRYRQVKAQGEEDAI